MTIKNISPDPAPIVIDLITAFQSTERDSEAEKRKTIEIGEKKIIIRCPLDDMSITISDEHFKV